VPPLNASMGRSGVLGAQRRLGDGDSRKWCNEPCCTGTDLGFNSAPMGRSRGGPGTRPAVRAGHQLPMKCQLHFPIWAPAISPFFGHTGQREAKPPPASLPEKPVSQCSPRAEDERIYERADRPSVRTSLAQSLQVLQHLLTIRLAVSSQLLCPQARISWSPRMHLSQQSC